MKRSIQKEDITIINMYASKNKAPKYMKQKLTKVKGKIKKFNNQRFQYPTYNDD